MEMEMWLMYFSIVLVSALLRYPIALLGLKICRHSDGGGWDAGSSYSYVPTLYPEESISYESESIFGMTPRMKLVTWIVYPLIPLYWVAQAMVIVGYLLGVLNYWVMYGEISPLIDRERYK